LLKMRKREVGHGCLSQVLWLLYVNKHHECCKVSGDSHTTASLGTQKRHLLVTQGTIPTKATGHSCMITRKEADSGAKTNTQDPANSRPLC
jgi:hypothetical protein